MLAHLAYVNNRFNLMSIAFGGWITYWIKRQFNVSGNLSLLRDSVVSFMKIILMDMRG